MPYIKLNNTSINRSKEVIDRFILVSSIIDSPVSPEDPKLITSIEDLDIYFEKDFTNRDYFIELLNKKVGLFLYRPTTPEKNKPGIYYNYNNYELVGENKCYLSETDLPPLGKEETLYLSKSETEGPWIWVDGLYYDIKNLPQNLENKTKSINIRDSLRILEEGSLETLGYNYCYPKYIDKYDLNVKPKCTNLDDYFSGKSFFSYTLKIRKDINFDSGKSKGYYIAFTESDETYLLWFSNGSQIDPIGSDYIESDNKFEIRYIIDGYKKSFDSILQEIINKFIEKGYSILNQEDDGVYVTIDLYTTHLSPNKDLCNLPGFELIPNISISNQIISNNTTKQRRIDFFSKTIGNSKEKVKIKISQIKRKSGYYTIEISKYDYIEVFTGTLFPDLSTRNTNEMMLDTLINNESKLVFCDLKRYRDDGTAFKVGDKDSSLYTGEWELSGGEDETFTAQYYLESLDRLKNNLDFVEDFLLIPNINYFRDGKGLSINYNYYPEYEILLDYAKFKGCQILIDNLDTEHEIITVDKLPDINIDFDISNNVTTFPKIIYKHLEKLENGLELLHGYFKYDLAKKDFISVISDRELCNDYMNNFIFNYKYDNDNYLIYFFRKILLPNLEERPGFYVFLDNIITGQFETKKTKILYTPPLDERFLLEKDEEKILEKLEECKSNYLSFNNHYYYYDQLFNGDTNKYLSIITRYLIGKIKRRIEVKKWDILNNTTLSGKLEQIYSILYTIASVYRSIVKNITITDIKESNKDRKLSLSLKLVYSELINKDIYINITINI